MHERGGLSKRPSDNNRVCAPSKDGSPEATAQPGRLALRSVTVSRCPARCRFPEPFRPPQGHKGHEGHEGHCYYYSLSILSLYYLILSLRLLLYSFMTLHDPLYNSTKHYGELCRVMT